MAGYSSSGPLPPPFGTVPFFQVKEKKASDYLLIHLSMMETLKELFRASFLVYLLSQGTNTRIRIQKTGMVMLVMGEYLSLFLITIDRVLKVKIAIKYNIVVTKKRILLAFLFCWAICIAHGVVV